jgi:hypothetical protein
MANATHLRHPSSKFKARLIGKNVVGDMAISAGWSVFLPLNQGYGMSPVEIALVFLRMAPFTLFVIVKERRGSAEEFWVWVFHSFFFNV